MAVMTHAKFHFNRLMLTLIFSIWASEPPGPGDRLKSLGLIGLIYGASKKVIFGSLGYPVLPYQRVCQRVLEIL